MKSFKELALWDIKFITFKKRNKKKHFIMLLKSSKTHGKNVLEWRTNDL